MSTQYSVKTEWRVRDETLPVKGNQSVQLSGICMVRAANHNPPASGKIFSARRVLE